MRRDFDGLQIRGQGGIVAARATAPTNMSSAMYGMNFGDGRGNVTLHAEYARQERVFGSDIPFLRRSRRLRRRRSDTGGLRRQRRLPDRIFFRDLRSDGIPDRVFFRDHRSCANIIVNSA